MILIYSFSKDLPKINIMLLQSGTKSLEKEDSGENGMIILYHRTRVNNTEKWMMLPIFNCKKQHRKI